MTIKRQIQFLRTFSFSQKLLLFFCLFVNPKIWAEPPGNLEFNNVFVEFYFSSRVFSWDKESFKFDSQSHEMAIREAVRKFREYLDTDAGQGLEVRAEWLLMLDQIDQRLLSRTDLFVDPVHSLDIRDVFPAGLVDLEGSRGATFRKDLNINNIFSSAIEGQRPTRVQQFSFFSTVLDANLFSVFFKLNAWISDRVKGINQSSQPTVPSRVEYFFVVGVENAAINYLFERDPRAFIERAIDNPAFWFAKFVENIAPVETLKIMAKELISQGDKRVSDRFMHSLLRRYSNLPRPLEGQYDRSLVLWHIISDSANHLLEYESGLELLNKEQKETFDLLASQGTDHTKLLKRFRRIIELEEAWGDPAKLNGESHGRRKSFYEAIMKRLAARRLWGAVDTKPLRLNPYVAGLPNSREWQILLDLVKRKYDFSDDIYDSWLRTKTQQSTDSRLVRTGIRGFLARLRHQCGI
jgi:hypothetical protein